MPKYLFRCTEGHEREQFFSMAEKPDITQCAKPGCTASARSVPQAAPVILRGGGWGGKP